MKYTRYLLGVKILSISIVLMFMAGRMYAQDGSFMKDQKRYPRVRAAIEEKGAAIDQKLAAKSISLAELRIIIVAYKSEKLLEVYVKNISDESYDLLETYKICATSGKQGPKRRQGDRQIPEGFYHVVNFNPASSYHLSMSINYPNRSDRLKSDAADLGGNICIHGSCVTIGCLPITDEKIKEVYLLAAYARDNGQQRIPVYIFPFKMSDKKMSALENDAAQDDELMGFWKNLKTGYDLFARNLQELAFTVDAKGNYIF